MFFVDARVFAQEETPSSERESVVPRKSFLSIERASRELFPDAYRDLVFQSEYSKRLPRFWGELELSTNQKRQAYAVQEAYYDEISALEARIERLEKERDFRMLALLTDGQRDQLRQKEDDAEKARKTKEASSKTKKKRTAKTSEKSSEKTSKKSSKK